MNDILRYVKYAREHDCSISFEYSHVLMNGKECFDIRVKNSALGTNYARRVKFDDAEIKNLIDSYVREMIEKCNEIQEELEQED